MAGHSKWANIKHRKERMDAKKGKVFTKLGREIHVAVKAGGADPENNASLKDAIAKAKAANMPNDSIERSIKKAAGADGEGRYEQVIYEGYGPGGVAMIIDSMTDNRNRTVGDVRHLFDKYGGNLGTAGCVSFMFDQKGVLILEGTDGLDEETLMNDAIEHGAEDFVSEGEFIEITSSPQSFSALCDALSSKGYTFISAQISMVPQNYATPSGDTLIARMEKLIDSLEDLDDVQQVYHNWAQEA